MSIIKDNSKKFNESSKDTLPFRTVTNKSTDNIKGDVSLSRSRSATGKTQGHNPDRLSSKNDDNLSGNEINSEGVSSSKTASYKVNVQEVIKAEKSGSVKDKIKKSIDNTLKESIIKDTSESKKSQLNDVKSDSFNSSRKKSPFAEKMSKELLQEAVSSNSDSTLADTTKYYVLNQLSRVPHNVVVTKKGVDRLRSDKRYVSQLVRDRRENSISGREAALKGLKRSGNSIHELGKNISKETVRNIEEFQGSDDLGVQAVRKPNNAIISTYRTIKVASRAVKSVKHRKQSNLRKAQKAKQKIQQITEYAARTFRMVGKLLSNPLVLKTIAIALVVALSVMVIMAGVSAVTSFFASVTYTASDEDLSNTYAYITDLDANIAEEIYSVQNDVKWSHINEFHIDAVPPETNPTPILSYLSIKYEDFTFSEVKNEIDIIHSRLYTLTYTEWTEEGETTQKKVDEDGNPILDESGNPIIETITTETKHLRVSLNTIPWDTYVQVNRDSMFLKKDDLQRYETLNEIGGTTLRIELGMPFIGRTVSVAERYGYIFDEMKGEKSFQGITKINVPYGTLLNASISGSVTTGYDSEYGNYVAITSGSKKVKYYNCYNITASSTVQKGQEIGNTSSYIYLEYEYKGTKLNPLFYIDKKQFIN